MYITDHKTNGFSLIEIMIAILIGGMLTAIVSVGVMSKLEQARVSSTKTGLLTLKQNIALFQAQLNSYPTRLADLAERPKGDLGAKWPAPFLEQVPQDGWGQDFVYKLTPGGKHPYQLFSYGGSEGPNEDPEKRLDAWNI